MIFPFFRRVEKKSLISHASIIGFGNDDCNSVFGNEDYYNKYYLAHPILNRVINLIVKNASAIPINLYTIKNEDKQPYKGNHPVKYILNNPNSAQGYTNFIEQSIIQKLVTGNNYILKDIKGNKVNSLFNLDSGQVSTKGGSEFTSIKSYSYKTKTYLAEEVIHRKYNEDIETKQGISPIKALKLVLDRSLYAYMAQTKLFENGGAKYMLLMGVANEGTILPTPEEIDAIEDRIQSKMGGIKKYGKIMAAVTGTKIEKIGATAVEMELTAALKEDAKEIAAAFNVPIQLISNEASTYNNLKEANRMLIEYAVLPELNDFVDELNKNLLTEKERESLVIDYDLSEVSSLKNTKIDEIRLAIELYSLNLISKEKIESIVENGI